MGQGRGLVSGGEIAQSIRVLRIQPKDIICFGTNCGPFRACDSSLSLIKQPIDLTLDAFTGHGVGFAFVAN